MAQTATSSNTATLEEMMSRYEKLVYTVCYQFTHNHYTAQDLTQETFLSVYTHLDSCPSENPKAWVARIAANKAKDYLKSAYSRKVFSADDEAVPKDRQAMFMKDENPEDAVIGREVYRQAAAAIGQLNEPYVKVATSYFLENKSVAEIARHLARPPKTVQTQVSRARAQLRRQLAAVC